MKSAENSRQNIVSVRSLDCDTEENEGSLRNLLSKTEETVDKEHFHQVDGEKTDQSSRLHFLRIGPLNSSVRTDSSKLVGNL